MKNIDYNNWNQVKKYINFHKNSKVYPRIREIWWINIGLNIGTEIYGKTNQYTRPVLVINTNKENFIGLPISSRHKRDRNRLKIKTIDDRYHYVLLRQIRLFDRKRLICKKYVLSKNRFKIITRKLKNMITTNV